MTVVVTLYTIADDQHPQPRTLTAPGWVAMRRILMSNFHGGAMSKRDYHTLRNSSSVLIGTTVVAIGDLWEGDENGVTRRR